MVTAEHKEAYHRDGVVLLRGALDRKWIDNLRDGVDQNIAAPGAFFRRFVDEGGGRVLEYESIIWPRIEAFRRFIRESPAGEIAAQLMGSHIVRLLNDAIFRRTAGTQAASPFH